MDFISSTPPVPIDRQSGAIKAWSFSALMKFNQCEYRVYLSRIAGHKEPQHEAAGRGDKVHGNFEDYIRGDADKPTKEMKHKADLATELRLKYPSGLIEVEQEWGFDANWQPCSYHSKSIWCRVKLDIIEHESRTSAFIRDWKTGKKMGNEMKHKKQLEFYAVTSFLKYPELQFIRGQMEYTDQASKNVLAAQFERNKTMSQKLEIWTNAGTKMTTATHFKPKPNTNNCKFCPFHPDKGGQCEFGV